MLSLFHRKPAVPATTVPVMPPEKEKGLLQPLPAATLLATTRRQKLLEHIWERTSLSRRQFGTLYRLPLERNAALVQQFPAVAWLKRGIRSQTLVINDAKALVHTVADTAYLVSPGVFQRYAQEHPQVAFLAKQDKVQDWQWVQKRFEKQGLHRKQDSGLNIWTLEISGPRKSRRLHGYLLEDPQHLFDEVPPNNPYLSISSTP